MIRSLHLRDEILSTMERSCCYQQRLLIGTEGTFSARLGPGEVLITPYPVDRKKLDAADLVLVGNGAAEEAKRPSRAVLNHRAVHQGHPDVGASVNAYTGNATWELKEKFLSKNPQPCPSHDPCEYPCGLFSEQH
jgi:L-fuculose-phosphate aldolase